MTPRSQWQIFVASIVTLLLLAGWTIAYASMEALPPNLFSIPWLQVLIGATVAAWGGATATLGRYLTAQYEARAFHWRTEAVKDIFVSVTVGMLTYLAGWVQTWHIANLGMALLLAGFLGVRVLSWAADRFMRVLEKP